MTLSLSPTLSARLARPGLFCAITMVGLLSFVVPFYGIALSLCLPVATHARRRQLWPEESSSASKRWSWLAWAGLWWPGVLSVFAPFPVPGGEGSGLMVSTSWLVIPLCGPVGLGPLLLPALAVAGTCLVGLTVAAATRRAWAWVAALWLAPWVHHVVFSLISPEWIC